MRKISFTILIVFILLFLSVTANALDGQRKGFLLGFGVGAGMTPFVDIDYYKFPPYSNEYKVLFKTDFRIGYAPDNFWQIYWMSKVFWFQAKSYDKVWGYYGYYYDKSSDLAIYGLAGLGVTYSFNPQAPSFFLTGGLGYSSLGRLFSTKYSHYDIEDLGDPEYGLGFFIGAGYEFVRHLNVEAELSYRAPSENKDWNGLSLSLGLNILGY